MFFYCAPGGMSIRLVLIYSFKKNGVYLFLQMNSSLVPAYIHIDTVPLTPITILCLHNVSFFALGLAGLVQPDGTKTHFLIYHLVVCSHADSFVFFYSGFDTSVSQIRASTPI